LELRVPQESLDQFAWWQKGIIYQVYPFSFQDSNGDGTGDLQGIIQRLDYLKALNIDAIWLSPIYPSPGYDSGYDVADYTAISPTFGTMADFDHLLAETHQRDLKLILDLVPNHTSIEHPWFVESASSRDNPKRDWYIWRDPAPDGGAPNNWLSHFGGSAWTYHEPTGQYYLHQFAVEQPELNYRHPDVLPAMLDVLRFWLDKGVDGFRVDVIWLMLKDEQFRDEPPNPDWDGVMPFGKLKHIHTGNLPEVHDIVRLMRAMIDVYEDRLLIGEIYLPNAELMKYYGDQFDECHLPFNFQLLFAEWKAPTLRKLLDDYYAALPEGAWPNWVLGNHDNSRLASRVGAAQARNAAMLLLTLYGTPTIYNGEEIGMEDVTIPLELTHDPQALNQPEIQKVANRDQARTPMQWDDSPNAGFSAAHVATWLPISPNYKSCNVKAQESDPTSILMLYRSLAALRRSEPALAVGAYSSPRALTERYQDVLIYVRSAPNTGRFLIVLNLIDKDQQIDLSGFEAQAMIVLDSNLSRSGIIDLSALQLAANEGLILRLID
jgi:alpha-glucosidase